MKKDDAKIDDAVVITDAKTEIAKFNLADAGIAELKKKVQRSESKRQRRPGWNYKGYGGLP